MTVKVGLIGLGETARQHAAVFQALQDVEIAAAADSSSEKLTEFCGEYGVAGQYSSAAEMLSGEKLDAVVVATGPASLNAAGLAVDAGLPVLMEFPVGTDAGDALAVSKRASDKGVLIIVGASLRFHSGIKAAQKAIKSVGGLQGLLIEAPGDGGLDQNSCGEQWLQTRGIHWVDLLRSIGGNTTDCDSLPMTSGSGGYYSLLRFSSGAAGQFIANPGADEGGRIVIYGQGLRCEIGLLTKPVLTWQNGQVEELDVDQVDSDFSPGFFHQGREFIEAIREGRPVAHPAVDLSDAVQTLTLMDAIKSSGHSNLPTILVPSNTPVSKLVLEENNPLGDQKDFEIRTRGVFDPLHQAQGEEDYIFNRLVSLLNTDYLQLPEDWFKGKVCLDAGCGSNGHATYSMINMGAEKVYAFDLDSKTGATVLQTVPKRLTGLEERYDLKLSNVLDMDYPDNFFDFAHCSGVLHHTYDVYKGLNELARVTKEGGTLYVLISGKGGLTWDFTQLLRQRYEEDSEFRSLMDGLQGEHLAELAEWVIAEMKANGDEMAIKVPAELIRQLFDRDLVLTIKDRVLSPVYHELPEQDFLNWFKDRGFTGVTRLTRYPKYQNVRRFLSPFYNRYDNWMARILYGDGAMGYKAIKGAGV